MGMLMMMLMMIMIFQYGRAVMFTRLMMMMMT